MGLARFQVDAELVRRLLHLPDGTRIIAVGGCGTPGTVEFMLESDELPTPAADEPIPLVEPALAVRNRNLPGAESEVVFVGWGLPAAH